MIKKEVIELLEDIQNKLTYNSWGKAILKIQFNIKKIELINSKRYIKLQNKLNIAINKWGLADKKTLRISRIIDKEINRIYQ